MVVFNEEKQDEKVEALHKEEEENLARTLSKKYNVSYIDLTTAAINSDGLRSITEAEAREANLAVFDIVNKKLKVAVLAPNNEKTIKALTILKDKGYIPTVYMTSIESLKKVWARYKDLSFSFETRSGALDVSNEEITAFLKEVHSLEDIKKLIEVILVQKKGYKTSRLLEIAIAGALALNASDVHLEPQEKDVLMRFRLDGVLTEIATFDKETYNLLLSRIKLLSGMKLNVKGAQDGRFSIVLESMEIEIRSSALPSAYDESIVMRILNPDAISVPLESMGIHPKLLDILLREIKKPEGMILTTGPTGSGKTTTLYAFLKKVYSTETKIITIENPIEYHLKGIVQTQVNEDKQYTFLEGLRSALRQDPDIIMVGEIRDTETAETAINSALTGHLVFSTLHTNNAAGTFPRLIDLGINPKILTSAVSVSMAQRLVRQLCPHCRNEIVLEGHTKELVHKILNSIKNKDEYIDHMPTKISEPKGCDKCNFTGYKGRIGIFEAILRSERIEKVVRESPSDYEIWKAAEDQNILNMRQDGIIKVLNSVTSLSELERVIDLEAER
ncbi:type II/IV secretion system protein [Candidatus Parcubacteria bacterium]|nr:type II/IV secretion system protein [Candidatus Parcubacteria bacterium]